MIKKLLLIFSIIFVIFIVAIVALLGFSNSSNNTSDHKVLENPVKDMYKFIIDENYNDLQYCFSQSSKDNNMHIHRDLRSGKILYKNVAEKIMNYKTIKEIEILDSKEDNENGEVIVKKIHTDNSTEEVTVKLIKENDEWKIQYPMVLLPGSL